MLTTREAAERLGISVQRVQKLLKDGQVPGAQKVGRDWLIPESALARITVYGRPGRPAKEVRRG